MAIKKKRKLIKLNKKIFNNTVRNKLIIISLAAILLPLIILGILSYNTAYKILDDKLVLTSQQTIDEVNRSVNRFLDGIESQVQALSENSIFDELAASTAGTTDFYRVKEITQEVLHNTNESNKDVMHTFFGRNNGEMYVYPSAELPEGFDPRKTGWYALASDNEGQVVWTDPYVDTDTGEIVVTAAKTVQYNGKVLGVLGVDIDLKQLSAAMGSRVIGRKGYVFVTTQKGIMLAHPDSELIGTDDPINQEFWEKVSTNSKGFSRYSYEGKDKFLSFTTNEKIGWKLMASMEEQELLEDTNIMRNYILGTCILGIFLGMIMAFIIAANISKPLNQLQQGFAKAAQGDLTTQIEVRSKDEFGELGKSFNVMITNLKTLIYAITDSSGTVLNSSSALATITDQVSVATTEIATAIAEIAQGATNQAKDTEDGSVQVNDLANKIETVTTSVEKMTGIVKEVNQSKEKGLEILQTLTQVNEENGSSALKVNEVILEVDQSSKEIGAITNTISQIADQTNLLALNAAIEAAMAGEHGRGFAVVAEEVRKLAEESAVAANRVNTLIHQIQVKSTAAVQTMEYAKSIVQEQHKSVDETQEIFNEISEDIIDLNNKLLEVRTESTEMKNKKGDIISIIESLSAASEETSAGAQQITASTEEQLASVQEVSSYANDLNNLAKKLQSEVNKFHI